MTLPSANTICHESVGASSPALRGLMVVAFSKPAPAHILQDRVKYSHGGQHERTEDN